MLIVTLYGKCLTGAGLTIREDANVVAIKCTLNQALRILEHILLSTVLSENSVKLKLLGHFRFRVD
jgi:hypothetical protein